MTSVALVVGCSRFQTQAIRPLMFSDCDADRVAQLLESHCGVIKENIALLKSNAVEIHSRATRSNILGRAADIVNLPGAAKLDRVYVFVSGHGVVSLKNQKLYYVCVDTLPGLIEETAVDIDGIVSLLRASGPGQIVVMLDTCRSVFMPRTKGVLETQFLPIRANDRFCAIIYSCAPGSASYESNDAKAGVFTEALVRNLGNSGTCATVADLQARLPGTMNGISASSLTPSQCPFFSIEEGSGNQIVLVDRSTFVRRRRTALFSGEIRHKAKELVHRSDIVGVVVALDFGTTKTLAALPATDGKVYFVPSQSGSPLVNSAIVLKAGYIYNIDPRGSNPPPEGSLELTNIKRSVGQDIKFEYQDLILTSSDLISMIMNSVRQNILDVLGYAPVNAVVSYPVNYSFRQLEQLKKGVTQAGFQIVRLVSEPAAAALALIQHYHEDIHALILDLGGGTFDVAVADCGNGVIEIISVAGDGELGGCDFDEVVKQMINDAVESINNSTKATPLLPVEAGHQLVERVKFDLSSGTDAYVFLGYQELDDGSLVARNATLLQTEFKERCGPLLLRIREAINRATSAEKVTSRRHYERLVVMLAGQGTRLNVVRAIVDEMFPGAEVFSGCQENAVVTGLAIQAGIIAHRYKGPKLYDNSLLLDVYHRRPGVMILKSEATSVCPISGKPLEASDKAYIYRIAASDDCGDFLPLVDECATIPRRELLRYLTFAKGVNELKFVERDVAGELQDDLCTLRLHELGQSLYWELTVDIDENSQISIQLEPGRPYHAPADLFGKLRKPIPLTAEGMTDRGGGSVEVVASANLKDWLDNH